MILFVLGEWGELGLRHIYFWEIFSLSFCAHTFMAFYQLWLDRFCPFPTGKHCQVWKKWPSGICYRVIFDWMTWIYLIERCMKKPSGYKNVNAVNIPTATNNNITSKQTFQTKNTLLTMFFCAFSSCRTVIAIEYYAVFDFYARPRHGRGCSDLLLYTIYRCQTTRVPFSGEHGTICIHSVSLLVNVIRTKGYWRKGVFQVIKMHVEWNAG